MKAVAVLLAGALIASIAIFAVPSASSTGEPSNNTTTPTPTTEVTTEEVTEVEDVNADIAEQLASNAPKEMAVVCKNMDIVGEDKTGDLAGRILGNLIIKEGGDVTETIDLLLDRC